ncbi:MAG: DoxX family membrane protein [Muribaculaceae bacterium]|nr:DoxX family membrane protein [Muribaculaceae bacterium]
MTIKAIINAVKGETWCRLLTTLMRLVVGGLFVFSGFTKAVDPWGTCYKITDYLNAMGMEQWGDTALFLAVALAALEFMVGMAIVVGAYRTSSLIIALLMMAVMTPVTLWLAITDAVPDCGCFGDALHLSNWATFFKNILLILGLIYLLMFNKSLKGVYGPAVHWIVMAVSFAMVMAVAYYGYFVQPLIDYRPYPVGTRLADMNVADTEDENGEDDFIFIYSRDGVEQEFTIDSLPDEEDGWEYVTRYHARRPHGKVIIQNGASPNSIAILDEEGNDVTLDVLTRNRHMVLLLFPDLPEVGALHSFALNELNDAALVADADVVALTPATAQEIEQWKDISMASYPIYNMDDSELKMIARGNPAVVYLEDGTIKWKRTLTSLEDVEQPVELNRLSDDYDADGIMTRLMAAFLLALLAILILNRSHLVLRHLFTRKKPTTKDQTTI